ncbi:MAG: hypothetical protein KBC64_00495 [Simkaniaceae bacterium]|nr:hypothetical protein [Simkaniaceae bacterium]
MLCSKKRITSFSGSLFFLGLAVVSLTGTWWPGMMLVIGLPLALKQYLSGRKGDMLVSLFVFVGIFIAAQFNLSFEILLPVLFLIAALYLGAREFLESSGETVDEEIEEINHEIEEGDLQ